MLQIEYRNKRIKPNTKHVNSMQIDRVVLRETLNSDLFYTKTDVNNLLNNKLTVPTQAEWDNFTLTLQG